MKRKMNSKKEDAEFEDEDFEPTLEDMEGDEF